MIFVKFDLHRKENLREQKYFTVSMPLLTPNHSYETCVGVKVFYRQHALAYPQPQL